MGFDGKKKISIIALSAILMVAIVGAVTYGVIHKNGKSESEENSRSASKAVKAICDMTNYKETCQETLASANSNDPKDLIKLTFHATMTNIDEAVRNSSLLKNASMDPSISEALDICKEVLDTSVEDIQSSIDKIGKIGINNFDTTMGDLKTLIGGAITFQETCLDAFENTTSETGEKMKKLLKTTGELTSNGLAMVSRFTDIFNQLHHPITSQKLDRNEFPPFVDGISRKLLVENDNTTPTPDAIVSKDGSAQFKTINEALATYFNKKTKKTEPFVIFVKEGIYEEHVHILKNMTRIVLIGEGPTKTKITGSKNFMDGVKTFHTATVAVDGEYFIAKDIGFENSAGPEKHQAVALRVSGDFSVLFNCQIDGYQDTLYAHNKRQFYRGCTISGTVDFVFGDAQAIFQNCKFIVRKPGPNQACMVTAQGRKDINGPGALVLQNCAILPASDFHADNIEAKAYLGRPWKEYSRTIIMDSNIHGFIAPEGWAPWEGDFALDTCYYAEFENTGPGAKSYQRVTWKGIQNITSQIADSFAPGIYYQGGDAWIRNASIPYNSERLSE